MKDVSPELVVAWRAAGLYPETSLGAFASRTAAHAPHAPLVMATAAGGETVHDLGTIHRRAACLAAGFRRVGLQPGDVVAVQMQNAVETVITHAAVAHAGLVLLPIIHIYAATELSFVLAQSGARAIITPHHSKDIDHRKRIRAVAPKGVLHIRVGAPADDPLAWENLAACYPMPEPAPRR